MTSDLLRTLPSIADYLNTTPQTVRGFISKQGLPTFKLGKTVAARRTSIDQWLSDREAAARVVLPIAAE